MFEKSTGSFDACLNRSILETVSMFYQLSLKSMQARSPAERSSDPLKCRLALACNCNADKRYVCLQFQNDINRSVGKRI